MKDYSKLRTYIESTYKHKNIFIINVTVSYDLLLNRTVTVAYRCKGLYYELRFDVNTFYEITGVSL